MIALAYSLGQLHSAQRYLSNILSYTSNNHLLLIQVLEHSQKKEPQKNIVLAKSQRLLMSKNFDGLRNNNDVLLDCILKLSKLDEAFHDNFKQIVKTVGKESLQQVFYNVLQYFAFFLCISELHHTIPFLAVAPNPYLQRSPT